MQRIAILVGVLFGLMQFRWGWGLLAEATRAHDWLGVAGVVATLLSLLPLALTSIFWPRVAAFAAFVCLLLAISYNAALLKGAGLSALEIALGIIGNWSTLLPIAAFGSLQLYASLGGCREPD